VLRLLTNKLCEHNELVSSFMSRPTHNRSLRRRVFPGNHFHWYWQLKTKKRKHIKKHKTNKQTGSR